MAFYYIIIAVLLGIYLIFQFTLASRFGKLLVAMRDDENRVRFMGYNPVMLKTLVFTVSCGVAGIAGALFVPQVGIISPTNMGTLPSIEISVWVAVGGRGTLWGPLIGAILVNGAKSALSESFPGLAILPGRTFHWVGADFPGRYNRSIPWRCPAVASLVVPGPG